MTNKGFRLETKCFFPQALLPGFSFRTGEYKAFAVRKIAAKPEQVPILHKILLGNVLRNVPGTCFGKKSQVLFLFDFLMSFRDFAEFSFFLVPPGITFCALSFLKGSNSSSSSSS